MKALTIQLVTPTGDTVDDVTLDEFGIAEPWDEEEESTPSDATTIIERVEALFESVLALLRDREAALHEGVLWLKLALGEALLTADESEGDVVLQVMVTPTREDRQEDIDDDFH
jgi:hypothetical protein